MDLIDLAKGLGLVALIAVLIIILLAPIIVGVVIATAAATFLGITGIGYWIVVVAITIVIWGILASI